MSWRAWVLGAAGWLVALEGQEAIADDSLETLRQDFAAGIAHEERAEWDKALGLFERIAASKMTPQVRFHLALCHENLGRWLLAEEGYRETYRLAKNSADARDVSDLAARRLADVGDRMPKVKLTVAGPGEQAISLDGVTFAGRASLIRSVDPGKHVVRTSMPGFEQEFTATPSSLTELEVPGRPEGPAAPADLASRPLPAPVVEPGDLTPAVVTWVAGGSFLAAGGVFFALGQMAIDDVAASCSEGNVDCDPSFRDEAHRGELFQGLGYGLGAAGLAAVAGGLVLYFTVGQPTTTFSVAPTPTGLTLRGTFF